MKYIEIENESRPLSELLPAEESEEVIYITHGGRKRFVVVPFDEGDEEALAAVTNEALMTHVTDCIERARKGPTKSLCQLRAELGLNPGDSAAP